MNLGLQQKVGMVSGASKGLGFAVSRALAAEGAYLSIASEDRDGIVEAAARIEAETGTPVIGVLADVRSPEALANWHATTIRKFGGVDLLFTNSGGPPPGQALTFDDAVWQANFELLVLSVVRLIRLVVPSMEARGGGAILMSTSSSVKEPIPSLALSNVLRASVAALAKTLAIELGPRRIRVNNILPGRIATDRMRQVDRFNAERLGISVEQAEAQTVSAIPLGRYGTPDEFGCVAALLLSDAFSYINGASLQVDGGLLRTVL
ncbi:MAG: SDR family oxidoreductase [Acidobacteria bacterium]|nr:SDR family oxidoreductase [Acidobacteriota bacterium]